MGFLSPTSMMQTSHGFSFRTCINMLYFQSSTSYVFFFLNSDTTITSLPLMVTCSVFFSFFCKAWATNQPHHVLPVPGHPTRETKRLASSWTGADKTSTATPRTSSKCLRRKMGRVASVFDANLTRRQTTTEKQQRNTTPKKRDAKTIQGTISWNLKHPKVCSSPVPPTRAVRPPPPWVSAMLSLNQMLQPCPKQEKQPLNPTKQPNQPTLSEHPTREPNL